MEVTKIPKKKIVTVIEPKRSMTYKKKNTDRKEWLHTAVFLTDSKSSSMPNQKKGIH